MGKPAPTTGKAVSNPITNYDVNLDAWCQINTNPQCSQLCSETVTKRNPNYTYAWCQTDPGPRILINGYPQGNASISVKTIPAGYINQTVVAPDQFSIYYKTLPLLDASNQQVQSYSQLQ